MLYPAIHSFCHELNQHFDEIPEDRKTILQQISAYILGQQQTGKPIQLMYVCTHNSRRSHFGQIWAAVAARFYGIEQVETFSGGTEATAFNPNAIAVLRRIGFEVETTDKGHNPSYKVKFGSEEATHCFSKVYDHPSNPSTHFAAIMTCSDAEENCPFIPGVALRIGTTYDDPKEFDNTPLQDAKYDERCRQIALETCYVFASVTSHS